MSRKRILVASFLSLISAISAETLEKRSNNPYQRIATRNIFRLEPKHTEVIVQPPALLPKVQLLGITTVLGDKRAIVKVLWPAMEGGSRREQTFILKDHESAGEIELLEIDEIAGKVRMNISGTTIVVSFETEHGRSSGDSSPRPLQPRR